jgi:hypothetical protein
MSGNRAWRVTIRSSGSPCRQRRLLSFWPFWRPISQFEARGLVRRRGNRNIHRGSLVSQAAILAGRPHSRPVCIRLPRLLGGFLRRFSPPGLCGSRTVFAARTDSRMLCRASSAGPSIIVFGFKRNRVSECAPFFRYMCRLFSAGACVSPSARSGVSNHIGH